MGSSPSKSDSSPKTVGPQIKEEGPHQKKCWICRGAYKDDEILGRHGPCEAVYHKKCWVIRLSMGQSVHCDVCNRFIGDPERTGAILGTDDRLRNNALYHSQSLNNQSLSPQQNSSTMRFDHPPPPLAPNESRQPVYGPNIPFKGPHLPPNSPQPLLNESQPHYGHQGPFNGPPLHQSFNHNSRPQTNPQNPVNGPKQFFDGPHQPFSGPPWWNQPPPYINQSPPHSGGPHYYQGENNHYPRNNPNASGAPTAGNYRGGAENRGGRGGAENRGGRGGAENRGGRGGAENRGGSNRGGAENRGGRVTVVYTRGGTSSGRGGAENRGGRGGAENRGGSCRGGAENRGGRGTVIYTRGGTSSGRGGVENRGGSFQNKGYRARGTFSGRGRSNGSRGFKSQTRRGNFHTQNTKIADEDDNKHDGSSDEEESDNEEYPDEFGFLIKVYKSNPTTALQQMPANLLEMEASGFIMVSEGASPFIPSTLKEVFEYIIDHPDAKPIKTIQNE